MNPAGLCICETITHGLLIFLREDCKPSYEVRLIVGSNRQPTDYESNAGKINKETFSILNPSKPLFQLMFSSFLF